MALLVTGSPEYLKVMDRFDLDPWDEIGSGHFATVYRGSRPNTVFKFTVDPASWRLLAKSGVAQRNHHFPRLVRDFGEVADVYVSTLNINEPLLTPLYGVEIERLSCTRGPERFFCDEVKAAVHEYGCALVGTDDYYDTQRPSKTTAAILRETANKTEDKFGASVRGALRELSDFILHYEGGAGLDLHSQNFMSRARSRQLVFADPVMDLRIHGYGLPGDMP